MLASAKDAEWDSVFWYKYHDFISTYSLSLIPNLNTSSSINS